MLSRGVDNSAQLAAAQARIAELETEIARLSARDPLVSSLLTLPAFRAQLELDVQRAHRYGRPLAVAVLDIDRFRQLNMSRGLRASATWSWPPSAQLLAASTRAHDLACRAGGDEFILLLPETPVDEAQAVLERILVDLEALEAARRSAASRSRSASPRSRRGDGADALLGQAQTALAVARAEGGGRVNVSDGSADDPECRGRARVGATAEVVAALAQALEERDQLHGRALGVGRRPDRRASPRRWRSTRTR